MKTLLISIDSKFIHSNLAVRYIKNYCKSDFEIDISEFTINQKIDYITGSIIEKDADLLCFSCYIWNIEYVKEIIYILKTANPNYKILIGGPEVSYNLTEQMQNFPLVDYISYGEGEITFHEFLHALEEKKGLENVKGLVYRDNDKVCINPPRELLINLDELVSPYNGDETYEDKIVYYESSRGCPFRCAFCMSSIDKTVRYFSMDRVKKDLLYIINAKARQIKFVDRTFNADYKRAMEIMSFIVEHNTNNSSIHFEITADIINDEFLSFLEKMPTNMFQFEIGVQTVNVETLKEINRHTNIEKLENIVESIKKFNNIHMHLDLIAGLPYENYDSFKISFNKIHNLYAEKLQLGFLKVLRGTKIYNDIEKHEIKYNKKAPYEIIKNKYVSYKDILKLKDVEELVDKYYNEKYFEYTEKDLIEIDYKEDAFKFYDEFSNYWKENNLYVSMHNRKSLYKIIYGFIEEKGLKTKNFCDNLLIDFVCSNPHEELLDIFDRNVEEDLRNVKKTLSKDEEFRKNYFNITDKSVRILNNFRILTIDSRIKLFVYKDKENIFERCKIYDITDYIAKFKLSEETK